MTDSGNYEMIGRAVVERRALRAREIDLRRELHGIGLDLEKFGKHLQNLDSTVEVTPELRSVIDAGRITELLSSLRETWKNLKVMRQLVGSDHE